MASSWYCALCKSNQDTDQETHIAERHSDPTPHLREVDGKETSLTDAEYVRQSAEDGGSVTGTEPAKPKRTVAPVPGIFESLGIKEDDIDGVVTEVVAGASCTDHEAKLVMETADKYCDFKVDRAHFIVSFVEWGFLTGFSETSEDAGGFYAREHTTSGSERKYVKASDLLPRVVDKFKDEGLGRDFTFRRMGRFLAPKIPFLISRNKSLQKYKVTGTPISNRLGIKPELFLTCTSIFENIKPFATWTEEERQCYFAHNASVTKEAKGTQAEFQPQDLRIDPEQARDFRADGENDFARRYRGRFARSEDFERMSKGQTMFEDMLAKSNARAPGSRAGLGHL